MAQENTSRDLETYDAIIIGGGPAGLAAALTLGRSRRRVLVVDAGHPRNGPAHEMHNFPGFDGRSPADYRDAALKDALAYPTVSFRQGKVLDARPEQDGFVIDVDGRQLTTRRLLLAVGMSDRLPDFSILKEEWGKRAFHCPYCHGYETGGSVVAILGDDPHRMRVALLMARHAAKVVWLSNAELSAQDQDMLARANVIVMRTRLQDVERMSDRLLLRTNDGGSFEVDHVLVNNEQMPTSDLSKRLGCVLNDSGLVRVDQFQRTSVSGFYAAGDCAHVETVPWPMSSVLASSASGQLAGAMIDQDLLAADFNLSSQW